jgi:predicted dehydrogenase
MGKRGRQHAAAFRADPSFELVGICNPSPAVLAEAAAELGNPPTGTDPAAMAAALRPDVFCFCTPPRVRLELIKTAIAHDAKLIAFEKPVALTSAEAFAVHLVDYTMWFNDYVPGQWALAQAAGRSKLGDGHPSPDYIAGFVQYANGVRGVYECGVGAPDQPEGAKWWGKNRIGAQGTEGFAEVITGGG